MVEPDSPGQADKAPISTHPAFPAIVALWFACLLGLGSLVLPAALVDRLVALTGIAALVPAAEPPLGSTARTLIALAAAMAGAAAGLLLARQVARSQEPGARVRATDRTEARECRPIAAHAELGEEGFEWLDFISEHGSPIIGQSHRSSPEIVVTRAEMRNGENSAPSGERDPDLDDWWRAGPDLPHADTQADIAEDEPEPLGDLGERADDLRRHGDDSAMFDTPVHWFSIAEGERGEAAPRLPLDASPLEELGLVQLAGRLGAAIERRRTLEASGPAPAPGPAPFLSAEFEAAEPEDAARAIASFFGSQDKLASDAEPAMKNPFSGHEEFVRRPDRETDSDHVEPVVSFPFGALPAAHVRPSAAPRNRETGAVIAPTCPSEEAGIPANSTHPSSAPPNRTRNGQDLRAALAALQRISGAA
ncbi:hypothetical protein GRI75_01790 [Altererythrobacter soli]|uniref:Uncharacterized protein n=1 Tax=Croceibacterium soli TaxID=1739690 RepID=A0A6I4UPL9_9SPHN|nr:hypothetical protein [Croceibacterium soli]MXP40376.1 hypothetical protein [Croceibacterium soli]